MTKKPGMEKEKQPTKAPEKKNLMTLGTTLLTILVGTMCTTSGSLERSTF